MGGWRHVLIIAERDFMQRARSKAFLLTMLLVVSLVLIAGPLLARAGEPDLTRSVGVVGETTWRFDTVLDTAAEQVELEPSLVSVQDRASGEALLNAGEIDALLLVDPDPGTLVWLSDPDLRLASVLAAALRADDQGQAADRLGLSVEDAAALLDPPPPISEVIEPEDPNSESEEAAVFVGMLLLYMSVIIFGQFVMMAVVEEKSSRVVELLLCRVLPYRLLAGKVLGIGALALVQIVVLAGALYVVATQVIDTENGFSIGIGLFAAIVGWFLVGFAFFAVLYAALGSTVTRQEDVQSVAMIPLVFVLPGYFVALFASNNPNSAVTTLTSILPPTSPFVMPVRGELTDVPIWQTGLSVVLLVAATYWMIRLAGRIYTGAILSIGKKVSLREAWRSSTHVPTA